MEKLVIIGAGYGFWETNELIRDINSVKERYKVLALLDDNIETHGKSIDGVTVVGGLDKAKEFTDAKFIFCIGSKDTRDKRKDIIERIGVERNRYATLIHPNAKVYSSAKLGYGCTIHHGAIIYSHSVCGDFVSLGANSIIGNDNQISDFVLIAGQSIVINRVKVGEGAYIASAVSVFDDIEIGKHAVVGMGTVLMKNVGENEFAFGNPARVMKNMEN